MFRICLFFTFLSLQSFLSIVSAQDCECTNCPQFMPDLFVGDFIMNVQGATNNTLGQNGQGVCGVNVTFDHTALCDISISLTSPSGQSVTLVGPIGQFCTHMGNVGTTWDVTFLPCGDSPAPDPGFSNQWNSNQAWGSNNNYSGSYFPFSGCLENFTGPVNGNWTLTVVDGQAQDVGNLLDFEVIFCDPGGINCISCAADAGVLPQPDFSACKGSSDLVLTLPPDYPPPTTQPPLSEYGYTYAIGGAGGVIQEFNPEPDLTGYAAGSYTVCGMSYYAAQSNLIPNPNGSLTITQLSNQLNSGTPPFCGNISSNCVNVTVLPLTPDEETFEEVCAPNCFEFLSTFYCQTGSYEVPQVDDNGCPFNSTLNLTILQPTFKTINEVVCQGQCSTNGNFSDACTGGTYTATLTNSVGCDSIITLNLTVLSPMAAIQPPASLSCSQTTVTLFGTNSSTGPGFTYNWTASNGGHLVGPTNQILATADAPGTYQLLVCRTAGNITCCDSTSVTVTSSGNVPTQPVITGNSQACPGSIQSYIIASGAGSSTCSWSVPPGATLLSGQGNDTIQVRWNALPGGNICSVVSNSCGVSQPGCLAVVVSPAPDTPAIQGPLSVCTGARYPYTADTVGNSDVYLWEITGGKIISGDSTLSIVVEWADTVSNAPRVCLRGVNGCGNGPQTCLDISLFLQPDVYAGADTAVCGLEYSMSAISGDSTSSGIWRQVSGPGTTIFADSTDTDTRADVDIPGVYLFEWEVTAGNCTDRDTVQVIFNPAPTTGFVQHNCNSTNEFYTVVFPVTGGTPPYFSGNGIFSSGLFISDPNVSGDPYSYIITDANGCETPTVAGSYNCNCQTNAGQMAPFTLEACVGDSVTAIFPQGVTLDADDAGIFVLHTGQGAALGAIFAFSPTGIFGMSSGMSAETTYYISYIAGNNLNGAPDLNDPCLSVAAGQPAIFHALPATSTGSDKEICGNVIIVTGAPGNGIENWSVISSPPGGLLTLSSPTNTTTDATASAFGVYQLRFEVSVNGCSAADTVSVTFNSSPLTGSTVPVCNSGNTDFTLSFPIAGGLAPYTVNGQTLPGALYTSGLITNGGSYSFIVVDANGCSSAPVTGSFTCSCGTDAGQVPLNPATLCEGDSITVVASGQFLNPGEVASYILHTSPGTPVGTILAQNKTGRFGFVPGMSYDVTYYISAVAGNSLGGFPDPNDPCLSVSQGRPVIFKRYPTPNAGINIGVCGPSAFLNSGFSLYPGAWSYITGPGSATITTPQNNTSAVNVSVLGTYTFRWTEANGICIASDEVQATFWDSPAPGSPVISCNSTNTGYTVSFSVTGGSSPYTVTGLTGSFSGNTFTSSVLTNGSAYSFSVKDVNGCQASVVSGSHTCPCATYAGTMSVTPLVFCASDPATAVWYNDATLDGDDVVGFILHSTPDATPGTVYAANTQPTFPLSAGLSTGTTYYISAIAGSLLNGTINLSDPCLSISPGTPVQWKPMPQATLSGTTSICRGESTNLTFSGTGAYPLSVTYSDGSGSQIVNLFGPQSVNIPVSPTQNTVYTIQSVSDGTLPVCSTSPVQSVTVTVNQPVNAGTATAPAELCSGTGSTIKLTDLVNGEDPGGFWSVASGNPVQGGFNAAAGTFNPVAQSPGTYIFRYNIDAAAPCPDQSADATVIIQQTPTADAGPDQVINCLQGTVTLNGSGSTGGTGISYSWSVNGAPAGTTPTLTIDAAGTCQLQVSSAAGCSDSDEAVVTLDPDRPAAQLITVENISCFGEDDGSIAVSGVTSGRQPVLFSVDGENFGNSGLFTQLGAGVYTITLQDAIGCEWESGLLTVTEPPSVQPYITDEVRVVLGDQANLEAIVTAPLGGLASIEWIPLLDTLNKGTLIQRFIPLRSLTVDIEVTDTAGCFARDRVQIIVEKPEQVYIPTVFKPGSQNLNDVFLIYCGRTVERIELLQIYDRWGEHLFEVQNAAPNDPASAWDGIYNGEIVMPGVYVYKAILRLIDGTVKTYTGDVTVLR